MASGPRLTAGCTANPLGIHRRRSPFWPRVSNIFLCISHAQSCSKRLSYPFFYKLSLNFYSPSTMALLSTWVSECLLSSNQWPSYHPPPLLLRCSWSSSLEGGLMLLWIFLASTIGAIFGKAQRGLKRCTCDKAHTRPKAKSGMHHYPHGIHRRQFSLA